MKKDGLPVNSQEIVNKRSEELKEVKWKNKNSNEEIQIIGNVEIILSNEELPCWGDILLDKDPYNGYTMGE